MVYKLTLVHYVLFLGVGETSMHVLVKGSRFLARRGGRREKRFGP